MAKTEHRNIPKRLPALRAYVGRKMIPVKLIAEAYPCDHGHISRTLRQKQAASEGVIEKLRAAIVVAEAQLRREAVSERPSD